MHLLQPPFLSGAQPGWEADEVDDEGIPSQGNGDSGRRCLGTPFILEPLHSTTPVDTSMRGILLHGVDMLIGRQKGPFPCGEVSLVKDVYSPGSLEIHSGENQE